MQQKSIYDMLEHEYTAHAMHSKQNLHIVHIIIVMFFICFAATSWRYEKCLRKAEHVQSEGHYEPQPILTPAATDVNGLRYIWLCVML